MTDKKTEALKLALDWFEWFHKGSSIDAKASSTQIRAAIREALAEQPAQQQALIEPIEFLSGFLTERLALERGIEWTPAIHDLCNRAIEEEKLAEQAAISAGPITPAMTQGITPEQKAQIVDAMQRYTAQPPRKPWSGLTTADRKQLLHDHHPDIDPVAFFDAVEAKLKEKNA